MAAICDGVDGYIARHYNQMSELGTILDPLADKLLLVSGVVLLSLNHTYPPGHAPYLEQIPLWLTVNALGSPDNGVIVASYIGSWLMAGSFLAIGSCMSALTRNQVIAFVLAVVLCLLLVLAGFSPITDLFARWASPADRAAGLVPTLPARALKQHGTQERRSHGQHPAQAQTARRLTGT